LKCSHVVLRERPYEQIRGAPGVLIDLAMPGRPSRSLVAEERSAEAAATGRDRKPTVHVGYT
jgi:hypothetical protein